MSHSFVQLYPSDLLRELRLAIYKETESQMPTGEKCTLAISNPNLVVIAEFLLG